MNFSTAVEAHLAWTVKFRQAIRNRHLPDEVELASDNCCALGEWLREVARPHCGHLDSFHHCLRHHADFHREAAQVARVARQHGFARAEALMAPQSPYTTASGMLMLHLGQLRREVAGLR